MMRTLWAKIRALLTGHRTIGDDLAEEIEAHLQMEIEENLSQGMAPQEAQRAARRDMGNATRIRENARETWTFGALENFFKDLAFACRMLRRNPGFTVTVVLTLALGIGVNTAMFTVIRGVLLKPLEYRNPDRLIRISLDNARQNYHDVGFSEARYETIEKAHSFAQLGAFFMATENMTISGRGKPEALKGARVSANFLDILGIRPALGRSFLPQEDKPGGPPVVMISDGLWKRRFGGDPAIAGKTIALNSTPYTIIGVLPEGFAFPFSGLDVWVTKPNEFSAMPPRSWRRVPILIGLARLKPGITLAQANAELTVVNREYQDSHPADSDTDITLHAIPLKMQMVGKIRLMLWLLFGAVGLVLLIACANVASLLLGRAASRSHEFAVRAALGAGRRRLIRQLLAESLLLAFFGGALGVLLAKWSLAAFTTSDLLSLPRASDIHLDGTVLAFTVALATATGIFFGLVPSLQASRPDLANMLRERDESAGRALVRRTSFGLQPRNLLVVGQVALSMILLIGAALLMETLVRVHRVHSGFQSNHLLTMQIALPPNRYNTGPKKNAFFRELIRRVDTLPGVQSAAAVLTLPMSPKYATGVQLTDRPTVPIDRRPQVQLQSITPGYFRTAGIPLRRGREFTDADDASHARLVVIINESFARRFWPEYPRGQNPIGARIRIGNSDPSEVVGIAADVDESGLTEGAHPEIYLPDHFYALQNAGLLVRTAGDPLHLANAVRNQVLAIDRDQPVSAVRTMDEVLESSVGQQRLTLLLLGAFASLALLLVLVGLYGTIAYSVVQRTREFGSGGRSAHKPATFCDRSLAGGLLSLRPEWLSVFWAHSR